ncbi:MAG: DUF3486 family protein [Betaproteobacteria bacterium]|nr:DUF3486 family protein [Betaproteobacteria bacterium]
MPAPAKIELLPPPIREELHRRLVGGAFSDYEGLAAWLTEQGYEITRSSVHRYGQRLERKLAAIRASTQAAAAIAEAAPDDADLRSAAVMSLVQTEIFDVLVNLQEATDEDVDPVTRVKLLSHAAKNIATLSRASVNQKKWETEVRGRVASAAEAATKIAKKGGLSSDSVNEIRRQILGIAA